MKDKIQAWIEEMTLEEKAGLCSGKDNWRTKAVDRLAIPEIWVSDGPHGLRKQDGTQDHLGINESNPAVCFPTACSSAASFDTDLLYEIGEELGKQSKAENVHVLLGPGVNIKRSPLCGRNFEYFSEDPLLSTELGTAFVKGVQDQGVGTSLKHFLANNQEHRRNTSSSNIDERTLREIYLRAFEKVVKEAQPWTIMSAYNKVNGAFASQSEYFLTEILRDEWGFEGAVVSDWGAVHDRIAALAAGCDLTMPAALDTDNDIVKAVQDGSLEEAKLNQACERILTLILKSHEAEQATGSIDLEKGHQLAQKAAEESIVLLKNQDNILPLQDTQKIAFIGKFAEIPRYQGSGSSRVNSWKVIPALEEVAQKANVTYAPGFDSEQDLDDPALRAEAVKVAAEADVAVIFAGLIEQMESEGFDRKHLGMPANQNALIEAVCDVQPNTIVILHNGGPIEMPWLGRVKGVLEAYLAGEAVGGAVVRLLFGDVNPSGRLPESFPVRLKDTPSYLSFPGQGDQVDYQEGIFVGYRYYETKDVDVLFPFGYGLSYTDFTYSKLQISKEKATAEDELTVSVEVTNVGAREGKEVVQLYVGREWDTLGIHRPLRELRAFKKISLAAGETAQVTFELDRKAFSYWDVEAHNWRVDGGVFQIQIGKSSHEIVLSEEIEMEDEFIQGFARYTMLSTVGDVIRHPTGAKFIEEAAPIMMENLIQMGFINEEQLTNREQDSQAMNGLPLSVVKGLVAEYENARWENLLNELNEANLSNESEE